ncbi:MAG: hypothetical protein V4616_06055 [Bacteroidota bacterium]
MKSFFLFITAVFSATIFVNAQSDTINSRFSIHAQATLVTQFKPPFDSSYSGENSLRFYREQKTSLTATLYLGARLWRGATAIVNPEVAAGGGLSQAKGVASALNGETFLAGSPVPAPYLARFYLTQRFSFDKQNEYVADDENQPADQVPLRYLSVTVFLTRTPSVMMPARNS